MYCLAIFSRMGPWDLYLTQKGGVRQTSSRKLESSDEVKNQKVKIGEKVKSRENLSRKSKVSKKISQLLAHSLKRIRLELLIGAKKFKGRVVKKIDVLKELTSRLRTYELRGQGKN